MNLKKELFSTTKRAKTHTLQRPKPNDRERERERERRGSMIDDAMLRTVATYVLYATAGFLFLPAGRDIVSHKTCILPG